MYLYLYWILLNALGCGGVVVETLVSMPFEPPKRHVPFY